jgi:hypothetical protein
MLAIFSANVIVSRNPPIQKNTSTAKYAAKASVERPGVVRIDMDWIQFLIFINLNHSSWPRMTQQIENTRIPFRNTRF